MILMIFGITGSKITFMEGVIFWILFLLYLGYLYIMSKKGTEQEEENVKDIPVWKCLLFMVLGGVMVVMGSDFAVSGATEIARFFGMSERFIGLTIVAFGTSLPACNVSYGSKKRKRRNRHRKYSRKQYFQYFICNRYSSTHLLRSI